MRKLLFLFFLALFTLPANVNAQEAFVIKDFQSDISLHKDGSMTVEERLRVDFSEERHGIFREIPVKYGDEYKQQKSIDLEVISVTDAQGDDRPYTTSASGGDIRVKIGDADVLVSGEQVYTITYEVDRAVSYFDDHDELYWDVTGMEWEADIEQVSAEVHLPEATEIDGTCYTGRFGSAKQDCEVSVMDEDTIHYETTDFLTIVAGWPKGVVTEPTVFEKSLQFLSDNYGYLLPFLVLIIMYFLWRRYGDDPEDPPGLVTQFGPPDELSPAQVGFLVDQGSSPAHLSAELVYLASHGYLTIKELPDEGWFSEADYELSRTNKPADDLKSFQKNLLNELFGASSTFKVSEIDDSKARGLRSVRKDVYKSIKDKKYFAGNPHSVKGKWLVGAFLVAFFAISFFSGFSFHILAGVVMSAIIVGIFAFIMPRRTKKGVRALEHALGFKKYIEIAEDRRVKWQEKENLFFDVMPYAMVFGVAKKWANAFKDLQRENPEWFEGTTSFQVHQFVNSMNVFSSSASSAMTPSSSNSASSSSGFSGGFSGGGVGGGGGGSW